MEAPPSATPSNLLDDPRQIYSELNQNHLMLKNWEEIRGKHADAEMTKKYYEGLQTLFEGSETVERATQEIFSIIRTDPSGVEGVHRQLEAKFLGSIKRAVLYMTKSGTTIDWEANSDRMVAALKRQAELCKKLPQVYPPQTSKIFEQDIVEHQNQFSFTFFNCAKRQVEDYKATMLAVLQKATGQSPGQATEGPTILIETPLLHHSINCMGNYDLLRTELEKAQADEANRTIDTLEFRQNIKRFAEAFKKVKEIGMAISMKNCEMNIKMSELILARFGSGQ